ncbi:NAD(P)H-dependent oxidoreductase [Clostridium sp. DJ247]|uniref:NAD(P)H-dependent oxidoreductase n=1 Tax=Clostridium sp. DJ247 TaxID=2726188 RepID=UPI0016263A41|nr:NAD(P)H-dependent oxidoreductase [Clostridium sp. DJ247]MBC2581903.1 NAD(P)H-dependent oxidoreductase [Clostridium sp. DJ247]
MNHLIIYAHPSPESFSNAIMTVVREVSMRKGHKTEIRDLYSMGFDPVLKGVDLKLMCEHKIPEEIKREKEYIDWANILTFIYPIWWTGMPAIIKGYIDKVFFYDIISKQEKDASNRVMKDKKVFIFNPMGTQNEAYNQDGMINSMKSTTDIGIFNLCGIEVIQHSFFGYILKSNEDKKKQYLEEVKKVISQIL